MINQFKCLKDSTMQDFLSSINEDKLVILSSDDKLCITITKDGLKNFFVQFNSTYPDFDEDIEIYLTGDNAEKVMILSSLDLKWWSENTRRINKLFKKKEVKEKIIVQYSIKCGIKNDNDEIEEVSDFIGIKKEAIIYLNKEYQIQSIKTFFNKEIYFMINDMEWKTIEQLKNEGVIEL